MDTILANIEYWLAEAGVWAFVVAPIIMTVVAILPVPAEAPAMANGMIFGPLMGSMITWSGGLAGAWISYEIARRYGRPLARRFVKGDTVERVDAAAGRAGWWGLLVLRFVPVVAFTGVNWGAGLADVPRWRFVWTTAVGIIPGAILFTSSGAGIGVLWRWSPAWTAVVLVLLVLVTAFGVTRRKRPPLAES